MPHSRSPRALARRWQRAIALCFVPTSSPLCDATDVVSTSPVSGSVAAAKVGREEMTSSPHGDAWARRTDQVDNTDPAAVAPSLPYGGAHFAAHPRPVMSSLPSAGAIWPLLSLPPGGADGGRWFAAGQWLVPSTSYSSLPTLCGTAPMPIGHALWGRSDGRERCE